MTNFFGPGSPYLTHPALTPERTSAEVDKILSWCPSRPSSVLDVGCGFGRHSIEFARRGLDVTGIDPSKTLLDDAKRRAEVERLNVEFVHSGGAEFVREDPFDLAVCLFTTLGQRDAPNEPSDYSAILTNVRAMLNPGGTFVVEVPERERAVAALVDEEQLGPVSVTRTFDPESSVLSEQFVTPTNTYDLAYELFSRSELISALEASGFTVVATFDEAVQPPPTTFMTLVSQSCQTF